MPVERLTVAEAARRLGVSPEAIGKRIKHGAIENDQDADGLTHVYVEVGYRVGNPLPDEIGNLHLERLLQNQEREIEYLREQLNAKREANRENRRLLAAALERMPALESHERSEDQAHSAEHEEPDPAVRPDRLRAERTQAHTSAARGGVGSRLATHCLY